jgi:ERF superfamily
VTDTPLEQVAAETIATAKPTNVVTALAAIMRDLPAIAKVQHPSQDGRGLTYKFRGIEEITAEAQGLFAKYEVVAVPRVRARSIKEITVNNNPWTDTFLEVDWTIYGPGGLQDFIEATTYGVGRDNSDKGTNKAMTQAFKYLLLEMLMIADPKDDNDGTNTENQYRTVNRHTDDGEQFEEVNGEQIPVATGGDVTRTGPTNGGPSVKQVNYAKALLKGAGVDHHDDEAVHTWFNANDIPGAWPGSLNNVSKAQCSAIIDKLKP